MTAATPGAPPPNLPIPPARDNSSGFGVPPTPKPDVQPLAVPRPPGGGIDAPDPFAPSPNIAPRPVGSVSAAPEPVLQQFTVPPTISVQAPPAFRQPPPRRRGRTLALLVAAVVMLALIGGVGYAGIRFFWRATDDTTEQTPLPSATPFASATPTATASSDPAQDLVDTDQDGLNAAEERFYGTDLSLADTDGDSFKDGDEVRAGYDPLGPGKLDSDGDGFPDPDEIAFGSDAFNPDSDGDGYSDGDEIENGYNPLIPSPGDKL